MIIECKYIPAHGMALWPFILVKEARLKTDARLINHERIHHRQQLELLLVGFYIAYLAHYLWNRAGGMSHSKAYRNIIFEREAFANDHNLQYLQTRKPYQYV